MASSLNLTDILVHEFNSSHTNPFIILIHDLNAKKNPPVDATQSTRLLLSVVTYNIIILVCLGIICLPYLQGKGTKNRRHWVVKRRYLDGRKSSFTTLFSSSASINLASSFIENRSTTLLDSKQVRTHTQTHILHPLYEQNESWRNLLVVASKN